MKAVLLAAAIAIVLCPVSAPAGALEIVMKTASAESTPAPAPGTKQVTKKKAKKTSQSR